MTGKPLRIVVWSGGDEQRFLEWDGTVWQAFESYTYGHYFEQREVSERDIEILFAHFGLTPGWCRQRMQLSRALRSSKLLPKRASAADLTASNQ